MSTEIIFINGPSKKLPTFADLKVGDMFSLENTENFLAIKVEPSDSNERYTAMVISNAGQSGLVKPGTYTHVGDNFEIIPVLQLTVKLDI